MLQVAPGVPGVQGEAAAIASKKPLLSVARVKAKVAVEATAKAVAEMTEAKHRGQKTAKATRAAEIQVDMWWKQAQTETSFLLLSDTEIDMGAFLVLQAKRVSWSTLVKMPQLNRVHTVNVNAADIPSFVQKFAGKSLKFIPVVKPQSFSSCRDQIQRLARAKALDIHFAGCNMRASRHVRTFLGSLWCPDLPPAPQAGIHTYVRLTCKELAQAWQSHMMKGEPFSHNLSALDRKAIDGFDSSIQTKILAQHWLRHSGSKIRFSVG